jgi:hypothetical protein
VLHGTIQIMRRKRDGLRRIRHDVDPDRRVRILLGGFVFLAASMIQISLYSTPASHEQPWDRCYSVAPREAACRIRNSRKLHGAVCIGGP